ncbi:hypothetical protein [Amycolatopsis eburnea]|uniref:Uncharacterized protein n=1 Tax=Amycolatopsis eburnea TaxID=2267691 RepID=A0A3R9E657_9PSEU|nr:hypothetical protein [Amycolatopsis eburnea]RSD21363.1 hypothetical protein EIY87_10975 [Amycolatopsis eburnea]
MATVRDEADARKQLRKEDRLTANEPRETAADVAKPDGGGSAALVADAGLIALDYDQVEQAKAALDERSRALSAHLAAAAELSTPLTDGHGPVAHWMRRSFGLRGGTDPGGVQATLRSYLDELASLRQALDTVATTHHRNDDEAAEVLRAGERDA